MFAIEGLLGGSAGGGGFGTSALTEFKRVEARRDFYEKVFDKLPAAKRDVAYFNDKFPKLKSPDDLLKDRRLTEFVLGSFQLESEIDKKAILKKALTEDPADNASLVNKLRDPRWRQFADALRFLTTNPAKAKDEGVAKSLIAGWRLNGFEKWQGETSGPAVREALYFKRSIGNIKTIWQAIANPTIAKVLRVGVGQPDAFAALDADQQHARLSKLVKLEDFKDPKKTAQFLQRFLVNSDRAAAGSGADPSVTMMQSIAANMRGVNVLV